MSNPYYDSIKDEDIRQTADNLQKTKGWDPDLAAVAAAAGPGSIAVLDRAFSQQGQQQPKETDAETKARHDRLRAQYDAAKASGDASRAIQIKNRLHQEGVFV